MRLLIVPITLFLAVGVGCDRGSKKTAVPLKFVIKSEHDGEIVITNDSKSVNPIKQSDGSLVMEVDIGTSNTYDRSRFPDFYVETAVFSDGTPIETNASNPSAKYYLGASTWDVKGNMVIQIHKKK